MNSENQRLKGMLTQVSNSYSALQMHLVTLMQQQQQQQLISRTENTHSHEVLPQNTLRNITVRNSNYECVYIILHYHCNLILSIINES